MFTCEGYMHSSLYTYIHIYIYIYMPYISQKIFQHIRTNFGNLSTVEPFLRLSAHLNHFLKSQHARTIFQYLSTFEPSPNTCTQVCLAHIMHNTHMRHHVHHACGQTYATWQRGIRGYSTVSIIAGLPLLECVHVWHMPGTSCIMRLSESCIHHAYLEVPRCHAF